MATATYNAILNENPDCYFELIAELEKNGYEGFEDDRRISGKLSRDFVDEECVIFRPVSDKKNKRTRVNFPVEKSFGTIDKAAQRLTSKIKGLQLKL